MPGSESLALTLRLAGEAESDELRRRANREALASLFERAAASSGLTPRPDRDGLRTRIPDDAVITSVTELLAGPLRTEVRRYNEQSGEANRLRVRAALHLADEADYGHWLAGGGGAHTELELTLSEQAHRVLRRLPEADLDAFHPVQTLYRTEQVRIWIHGDAPDLAQRTAPAFPGLPPGPAEFVGRADALAQLDKYHRKPSDLVLLTGRAGLGKTALAVHWARRNATLFPGGVCYLDLAALPEDRDTALHEARGRILRGLGLPPDGVPEAPEARSKAYSARFTQPTLLLLDNPRTAEEVLRLRTYRTGPFTVAITNKPPHGLTQANAPEVALNVLPRSEAAALAKSIVDVSDADADELAWAGDYLPGSIRQLAAGVAAMSTGTVSERLAVLADQSGPLEAPGDPPEVVVARCALRVRKLSPDQQRRLTLLSLAGDRTIVAAGLAALAEISTTEAGRALDELHQRGLLERPGSAAEYRLPAALADYAGARLRADEPAAVRSAAARRLAESSVRREEFVSWLNDSPAAHDDLKRAALADVLAVRLKRMSLSEPNPSFLVHLEGPWGSGKTTLLGLLSPKLADEFLVVEFDAWRHNRVDPPWWALLTTLRQRVALELSAWGRTRLRLLETVRRARRTGGGPFLFSGLLVTVVVLAAILWLSPAWKTPKDVGDTARAVTAIFAAVIAIWVAGLVASRFLLWNSARGARRLEQIHTNPMQEVAEQFAWLVSRSKRRVMFFIDDLDRCSENYVVDLLDAVQTLVRDAPGKPRKGQRSAYFLVAAHGNWLRQAYEVRYEKLAPAAEEPTRPLGYLFLDKLFQLSVPMPAIGTDTMSAYFNRILNIREPVPAAAAAEEAELVASQVERSSHVLDAMRAWEGASPPVREFTAPATAKKLAESASADLSEHALQKFAGLLHRNPRGMKRFVNTYSVLRATRTLEGVVVDSDALALWTVLRVRWPVLADYLERYPDSVGKPDYDEELLALLTDPELGEVLEHAPVTLTAELIRTCCGAQSREGS
ncbi:P-loop NTPase fold protein [Amycolatopsis lurida]